MGIFPEGVPLSWHETKALSKHVQKHGVQQFINLYHKSKDRKGDPFKWGDEFEYIIVKFDDERKEAKVACKSQELLNILNEKEKLHLSKGIWSPEFGAYQLESSPLKPFEGSFEHFKTVEHDMRMRRREVQELLDDDECIITLVNSLRYGCKNFTYPAFEVKPEDPNSYAKSLHIPDEVIYSGHHRYLLISRNILSRRGGRTHSKVKVFVDKNTKLPIESSSSKEPDAITFDNTFGCNLQVTFQGADMAETRYLYDQLAPLCPIIQAVTAAFPIFRGYLTEIDNSYNILGDGSDDRTAEERGLKPLKNDKCRLTKKRWDSIDSYLTPEADMYNDFELYYDKELFDHLRNEGVDHVMAKHVAHIFMHDSLLMFRSKLHQDDEIDTGHFDNINGTTWQTLRFKPAIPNSDLCWRVEFRPCDIQITDFENAAVSCFVILLTRTILHYRLNFLMPISKIDANMETAQKRDACRRELFYFRKNITKPKAQFNGGAGMESTNGYSNRHSKKLNNGGEIKAQFNGGAGIEFSNSFSNGHAKNFNNGEEIKTQLNGGGGIEQTNGYSNGHAISSCNGGEIKTQLNGGGELEDTNGYSNGHGKNSYNGEEFKTQLNGGEIEHTNGYSNGHAKNSYTGEEFKTQLNGGGGIEHTNGYSNGHAKNVYNGGELKAQLNGSGTIETTNGYSNDHVKALKIVGEINGHYKKTDVETNGNHRDDYIETNGVTKYLNKDFLGKELELMTIDEIFNGKSETRPGLIPLIRSYLNTLELDNESFCVIDKYLKLIERRASGEFPTNATWLRQQVLNHPEYKNDSVVSERINYDILKKIKEIQEAEIFEFNLFL